jgi:hypothetical protein
MTFPSILRCLPITAMAACLAMEPVFATAAAGFPIPVTISGTLGTGVNMVDVSGQVIITPRVFIDAGFSNRSFLELVIDFRGLRGVARTAGKEVFVTEAQTIIHRPLLARDAVEVTFPYYMAGNFNSARAAKATLAVVYDARSGIRITSAIKDLPTN